MNLSASISSVLPTSKAKAKIPSIVSIVLGISILFVIGFSNIGVVHNAAHDTRHSLAFPCH